MVKHLHVTDIGNKLQLDKYAEPPQEQGHRNAKKLEGSSCPSPRIGFSIKILKGSDIGNKLQLDKYAESPEDHRNVKKFEGHNLPP